MLIRFYSHLKSYSISLVSGILLSVSLSFMTTLLTSENQIEYWLVLFVSSITLLVSSVCFYLIAPALDEVHHRWAMANYELQSWETIVKPYLKKLNVKIGIGFSSLFVSIVLLIVLIFLR